MFHILLLSMAIMGCAGARVGVRATERVPVSALESIDWDDLQVLIVEIRDPSEYLVITPEEELRLRLTFLERSSGIDRGLVTTGSGGQETLWLRRMQIAIIANDLQELVETGYLGIIPIGESLGVNPLHARCPRDLIRAFVATPSTGRAHTLEASGAGRDASHGCL